MTRKRNNFLLFMVISFLLGNHPEASSTVPSPKAIIEEMSEASRKVATQLVKDVEAKKNEKSEQKKWTMGIKYGSSVPADSQADLNEIATLYQAMNYADIAALDYLKKNCEQNGGAFSASMDPALCGEYITTMYKTLEGRVNAITAQYSLSEGLLKAPPEWPEHAIEVLNLLQKYNPSCETIYGAERGLVKKLKDQSEGRLDESTTAVPSASPVEKMRGPIILPDLQSGGSGGGNNFSGNSNVNNSSGNNNGNNSYNSGNNNANNYNGNINNNNPNSYSGVPGNPPPNSYPSGGPYGNNLYAKDARWDNQCRNNQGYWPQSGGGYQQPPPSGYGPPSIYSTNPYPPPPPLAPAPPSSSNPPQAATVGSVMLLVPSNVIPPLNAKTTEDKKTATLPESNSTTSKSTNTNTSANVNSTTSKNTNEFLTSSNTSTPFDGSDIRWLTNNFSKSETENK